jgi:pimeloyl-ACP methyl ester carboxylesterase
MTHRRLVRLDLARPDLGSFVGLFQKLNFGDIACPTYLLVGAADEVTTPEQVLDAAKYLGTPADQIIKKTVPGEHMDPLYEHADAQSALAINSDVDKSYQTAPRP